MKGVALDYLWWCQLDKNLESLGRWASGHTHGGWGGGGCVRRPILIVGRMVSWAGDPGLYRKLERGGGELQVQMSTSVYAFIALWYLLQAPVGSASPPRWTVAWNCGATVACHFRGVMRLELCPDLWDRTHWPELKHLQVALWILYNCMRLCADLLPNAS